MKRIILYGVFLVLTAGFVAAPPLTPDCGNYVISLKDVTQVNGDYKWTYEVCQNGDPAISHWSLESCICSNYASVPECITNGSLSGYGSSLSGTELEYVTDSHTGITGFKFEDWTNDFPDGCETFWILTSISTPESQDVGLKASDLICTSYPQVDGPAHETTTTTTIPPASEFNSLAIAVAILLASPAFAYLVVKKDK